MDDFVPVLVVGIVFYSVMSIIRLALEHKTRTRLIERGLVDENVKYLYTLQRDSSRVITLKWGIILVAIGSALFVGELFPYYVSDKMTIGFMFLFAGLGLLTFHLFDPKKKDMPQIPPSA